MFRLKHLKLYKNNDQNRGWKTSAEFLSPDRSYSLIYFDPDEIINGFTVWSVKLIKNGQDITADHPVFSRKFPCNFNSQPWGYDSKKFFLGRAIYDIETKLLAPTLFSEPNYDIHSIDWIQGSRKLPVFLVKAAQEIIVLGLDGTMKGMVSSQFKLNSSSIEAQWLASEEKFLIIGTPPNELIPKIVFYDGRDFIPLQTVSTDSVSLVPFMTQDYKDKYSCVRSLYLHPGWVSYELLFRWRMLKYNSESNVLKFNMFYAYGDVYKGNLSPQGLECKVEDMVVELEILEKGDWDIYPDGSKKQEKPPKGKFTK